MPIGSFEAVPFVASTLLAMQPRRVLDVGLGFGLYGAAVRSWVDLGVRPWRTFLVGVEGFSAYRNPTWDLYDMVFEQPIERFLSVHAENYDVVLAADIIEHFDQLTGIELLKQLKQRVAPGGRLIVVTPAVFFAQAAVYGNEYEVHRSFWSKADLELHGLVVTLDGRHSPHGIPTFVAEWSAG